MFASFGIVQFYLGEKSLSNEQEETDNSSTRLFLGIITIVFGLGTIAISVSEGSRTTKAAEKTKVIVSKIVHRNQSLTNQDGKVEFILLMTQIQLRNLNLQNCFFTIDWRVLLAVSPILRV